MDTISPMECPRPGPSRELLGRAATRLTSLAAEPGLLIGSLNGGAWEAILIGMSSGANTKGVIGLSDPAESVR